MNEDSGHLAVYQLRSVTGVVLRLDSLFNVVDLRLLGSGLTNLVGGYRAERVGTGDRIGLQIEIEVIGVCLFEEQIPILPL